MTDRTVAEMDSEIRSLVSSARKNRKLSQAKLAELMNDIFDAGWFQQTVQKFEAGDRGLSAGEFVALSAILNIRVWTKP